MLNPDGVAILGKKHLQNGKDFGRCVCIIKKPGGLPRWAVLPAFSLPVFNFFITNKTKDRRVAVCPGIRNPPLCAWLSADLLLCCGAKLFKCRKRHLRGVRTQAATAKTKDRRMAVCPGIRNPRFAPGFLRICCYAAAQSFSNAASGI